MAPLEKLLTNFKIATSKNNIRTLERKKKKLPKNKNSILFNQTCLNEMMLPKYAV